ncbi:MAG: hypothetical protein U0T82_00810 [Bacteroidales bacterium]
MSNLIILTLIILLAALVTGRWLSLAGRPLKSLRFTLHKLLSLACMALVIYLFWQGAKEWQPDTFVQYSLLGLLISAGITFITGALLSFDKLAADALRLSHRWIAVLSFLVCLASSFMLFQAMSKG